MVRCKHLYLLPVGPSFTAVTISGYQCLEKKGSATHPEEHSGIPLALHACNSTTSPSASGCSRPTCCPSNPDLPHTRAYFSARARSLCTNRATSSTVCPRRNVNGRFRSGGRPGTFV